MANPYQSPLTPAESGSDEPRSESIAMRWASTSFGASVLGLVFLCLFPLGAIVLTGISIFYGHRALAAIKRSNSRNGRDIATAGLVIGYTTAILLASIPLFFLLMMQDAPATP